MVKGLGKVMVNIKNIRGGGGSKLKYHFHLFLAFVKKKRPNKQCANEK